MSPKTRRQPNSGVPTLVKGFVALFLVGFACMFLFVFALMLTPIFFPEQAGAVGARGVRAADVACSQGCEQSSNYDLCYSSCVARYANPNDGTSGR